MFIVVEFIVEEDEVVGKDDALADTFTPRTSTFSSGSYPSKVNLTLL